MILSETSRPADMEFSDIEAGFEPSSGLSAQTENSFPSWMSIHVGVKPLNLAKAYAWLRANKLIKRQPTRSGTINICVQVIAALFDESPLSQTMNDETLLQEFFADTPGQQTLIRSAVNPQLAATIERVVDALQQE